jgi:uncharacterized protein YjdB
MKRHSKLFLGFIAAILLVFGILMPSVFAQDETTTADASAESVTVDVEYFTLGQGYRITPTTVELQSGDNLAKVITRFLEAQLGANSYKNGGTVTSSFYLSAVADSNIKKGTGNAYSQTVPAAIQSKITEDGGSLSDSCSADGYLGEFDFTDQSGWTGEVNTKWLTTGFDGFTPKNGDVIRLGFSVWGYGSDWADTGYGSWRTYANLDTLMKTMASAKTKGLTDTDAYKSAVTVSSDLTSTQTAVDAANTALQKTIDESGSWTFTLNPADAVLKVYDVNGNEVSPNTEGKYENAVGDTYTVTKAGYKAQTGTLAADTKTVAVTLEKTGAQPGTVSAFWPYFRCNAENNGITDVKTPINAAKVQAKWIKSLGSGWSASPTPQIIVDNSLIVLSNKTINKLNLETGEVEKSGTLSQAPSYAQVPPIYADGMIICQLGNGTVEAFNATTLDKIWTYQDPGKGQGLCPITYSDGYVYTGFWNGNSTANYVCLSVSDEGSTTKTATWRHGEAGGYYWSGAVAVGDALIVGTNNNKLLVLDKLNGEVRQSETVDASVRSTICYDKSNNAIYFTTKNNTLYKANVNSSTGAVSALTSKTYSDLGTASTSTPVAYNGCVYFGCGSGFAKGAFICCDADTLAVKYSVELQGNVQASPLLSTGYASTGYLYFYTTFNSNPGGITMIKAKADGSSGEKIELYTPESANQQYCNTSVIAGEDGTLYYKNDSCKVFAIEQQKVSVTGVALDKTDADVVTGGTLQLTATVTPDDATNQDVTWKSSDESVATVDAAGKVTALKAGKADISVVTQDGGKTAACSVTVKDAATVTIDFSAQKDNTYLRGKKALTVTEGIAAKYGFANDSTIKVGQVSTLDAIVAAHVELYGEKFTSDPGAYLEISDSQYGKKIDKSFGVKTVNVLFYIDGSSSVDSIDKNVLKDGASMEYYFVQDTEAFSDQYTYFADSAKQKIDTMDAKAGVASEVTLYGDGYDTTSWQIVKAPVSGATLKVLDADGKAIDNSKYSVSGKTGTDGKTTITFKAGGTYILSAYMTAGKAPIVNPWCTVTVSVPVSGISLDKTAITLGEGNSQKLTAVVLPADASENGVTWKSSDEKVAVVDENGNVTAKASTGSTTITATTKDGGFQATCTVTAEKSAVTVMAEINDIGTVELTDASKAKIDLARKDYDALSAEEKAKVNNYSTLLGAEKTYAAMAEAQPVIDQMQKAEKTITANKGGAQDAYDASASAYNKLSDAAKTYATAEKARLDEALTQVDAKNHSKSLDGKNFIATKADGTSLSADIELIIDKALNENSDLTKAKDLNSGKTPVMTFSAKLVNRADNSEIENPGYGIKITVACDLTGYDTSSVIICHIKTDGTTENLSGTYDAAAKTITFTVSSFSDFVVMADKSAAASAGTASSATTNAATGIQTTDTGAYAAILLILAALTLVTVVIYRRRMD